MTIEQFREQINDIRKEIKNSMSKLEEHKKRSNDLQTLRSNINKFNKMLDEVMDSTYGQTRDALRKKGYGNSNFSKYYLSNISGILNNGKLSEARENMMLCNRRVTNKLQGLEDEILYVRRSIKQAENQLYELKSKLFELFGTEE